MRICYTNHAVDQMQLRHISEEQVEYCLTNYSVKHNDRDGNPIYRATLPNGQRMKVIVKPDSTDPFVIITATID